MKLQKKSRLQSYIPNYLSHIAEENLFTSLHYNLLFIITHDITAFLISFTKLCLTIMFKKDTSHPECLRGCLTKANRPSRHSDVACPIRKAEAIHEMDFTGKSFSCLQLIEQRIFKDFRWQSMGLPFRGMHSILSRFRLKLHLRTPQHLPSQLLSTL